MTASVRDASPSPSADQSGGDQDSGDMAEHAGGSRSKDQSTVDGDENAQSGQKSSSNNAKDPLRPRRKKARRACFACQRAHLTCGMLIDPLYCDPFHVSILLFHFPSGSGREPQNVIVYRMKSWDVDLLMISS